MEGSRPCRVGGRRFAPGGCAKVAVEVRARPATRALATLNGLAPEDVVVELLLGVPEYESIEQKPRQYRFAAIRLRRRRWKASATCWTLHPELCGRLDYRLLAELDTKVAHPFELGLIIWN